MGEDVDRGMSMGEDVDRGMSMGDLHGGAMEVRPGSWHGVVRRHRASTRRLAEDHDSGGVAIPFIGSISASPTACLLRGYGRAGTPNERLWVPNRADDITIVAMSGRCKTAQRPIVSFPFGFWFVDDVLASSPSLYNPSLCTSPYTCPHTSLNTCASTCL